MTRTAKGILLGIVAAAAAVVVLLLVPPVNHASSGRQAVRVKMAQPGIIAISPNASPAPTSGLSHASPPDPAALSNAPCRQAVYDAEAKPGEFVTPPNVSIEH